MKSYIQGAALEPTLPPPSTLKMPAENRIGFSQCEPLALTAIVEIT